MGNGFCPLSCRQAHTYGMLVGVAANMKESSDDYRDFVFTVARGSAINGYGIHIGTLFP
jgi:hypothetical protein